MECFAVHPRIYVSGSVVSGAPELRMFDVIVCAAREHQPQIDSFAKVLSCPIEDADREFTFSERTKVRHACTQIANYLYQGKWVLVSSVKGKQRAPLLAAVSMKLCTRMSTEEIVSYVRRACGDDALSHDAFIAHLEAFPREGF